MAHRPPRRYRLRGSMSKKCTGLRALYFRYCYELHIIVKRPASVKRVPFSLREDMAKLDRLDRETRYLGKHSITTIGEVTGRRESAAAELEALTAQRQAKRNALRRLTRQGAGPAAEEVKREISALSRRIGALRKEVVLCDGIAERSGRVKANLEQLLTQKETERKERSTDELFRRRGGTGRAYDAGGR
ncbi:hypothetical protein CE91St41_02970 [Oscillospiraceae bacterium]|nr:hypothetical protein CE91St40_02970 [Oscillospiraceae bacterium]BDF73408.1 hypothetical protein CE91St41_02970 [Oscillospiraceae bacterium]